MCGGWNKWFVRASTPPLSPAEEIGGLWPAILGFNPDIMYKVLQKLKSLIQDILTNVLFNDVFKAIDSNSIVIDCGANVGDISLRFAEKGAVVYAFEPNPYAYDILSKRLKKYENATCINKGVWTADTTMKLFFHQHAEVRDEAFWSFGSSLIEGKSNVDKDRWVEVQVIDLTEFIESLDTKISLLKMDIEGAECEVLEKLIEKEQHKKIDLIVVETHDRKIPGQKQKTDKIRAMIRDRGIGNIKLSWL